jgi:hypothetical protein
LHPYIYTIGVDYHIVITRPSYQICGSQDYQEMGLAQYRELQETMAALADIQAMTAGIESGNYTFESGDRLVNGDWYGADGTFVSKDTPGVSGPPGVSAYIPGVSGPPGVSAYIPGVSGPPGVSAYIPGVDGPLKNRI